MTSAIEAVLRQPAAQVVGWALLHFVWQGAIIGGLAALALAALRRSAADVRYVVAAIALSLMLTLPVVTATQMWRATIVTAAQTASAAASQSSVVSGVTRTVTAAEHAEAPRTTTVSDPARRGDAAAAGVESSEPAGSSFLTLRQIRLDPWLPILVLGWLCGVAVLTLRLLSGWLWVQRMKSRGTVAAGAAWQHMAARLARRLHIARRIRLLESTMVDVPTVIGWIKPVVLLPASALAGLTPHQLEAVLAHELAHIRRHDYLVNLLQTLVETLLFYHPAVWWLSRRIRIERENCCDDLAVSLCGDPYTYAKALADLEELRGSRGQLVMAANGGSLVQRVRRLLGAPTHAGRAPGWLAGSATVLVMLGIGAGAVGGNGFQAPASAVPTAAPAQAPVPLEPNAAAGPSSPAISSDRQPPEAARAMDAAAGQMDRKARILRQAAEAAIWLQHATNEATTPFIAGQTLEARASAMHDVARGMAAQADASGAALAGTARELSALDAARMDALPAIASTRLFEQSDFSARALSAMDAARASALPAFAAAGRGPSEAFGTAIAGVQSHGTMSWSHNGEKLEVTFDGEIEFTDDDLDVKRLSPGGSLRIRDGGVLASHTVEFKADASGAITRRFWDGMSERPFEPEGRQWVAKMLPRFIRQTGMGAAGRVARIYKAKGTPGVLAEISLIEGSWAKKTYFTQLLKTAPLDPAAARQVLVQAGHEIDSDFELASLLIDSADKLLVDDATRQAYFEAARTIGSDFEMRRVYSSALKRGPVSAALLAGILDASRNIESDFEEASLLTQIAKLQPLDATTRGPFFSALGTVESDFEHRRVLSALAGRSDLTPDTTVAMLLSGGSVQSDFEAGSFLLQMAKQQPIEGALRAPFFRALESVGSSFERGRVLQAVVARPDASADTILAALRATAGMNGSFEASQVLLATAAAHPIAGPARDAYIDAAEKLGDFEQGKVLAALVRSERRK